MELSRPYITRVYVLTFSKLMLRVLWFWNSVHHGSMLGCEDQQAILPKPLIRFANVCTIIFLSRALYLSLTTREAHREALM